MALSGDTYGVKTQHREYQANVDRWQKIRDVLNANCKHHLRDVGACEPDKNYAAKRTKDYRDGAIFYNFTKRTLAGMVGAVMRKPPEIKLPESLSYLMDNCDGSGLGLIQQAQDVLGWIDAVGRGGLLVDSPSAEGATMAEQNAGKLNPRIVFYSEQNIINWHEERRGSTKELTQVVLRELFEYKTSQSEFIWEVGEVYRVLELVEGKYQQRVFTFSYEGELLGDFELIEPRTKSGPLNYIPFQFLGADNNDPSVDAPPLEPLADVNIGHYRNSADVEESAFIAGQPTLFTAPGQDVTYQSFKEANPDGIRLGSRTGHWLGAGGNAFMVQAPEVNISRELMKDKEDQAVKIGAQLITPTVQVTAEAARLQRGADTSIMATIAQNVSMGYENAIKWCADLMKATGEIVFELNTEFFMQPMTAQDRAAWIADINAGLMPQRAYWAAMRAAGTTNWTDEEIEKELDNQQTAPAPEMNTTVQGEIPAAPVDNNQNQNNEDNQQ